jgi:hypothetical protein
VIRDIGLVILVQTLVAAEQGSFHKAGMLLHVPASTVSRRVKGLFVIVLLGFSRMITHRRRRARSSS